MHCPRCGSSAPRSSGTCTICGFTKTRSARVESPAPAHPRGAIWAIARQFAPSIIGGVDQGSVLRAVDRKDRRTTRQFCVCPHCKRWVRRGAFTTHARQCHSSTPGTRGAATPAATTLAPDIRRPVQLQLPDELFLLGPPNAPGSVSADPELYTCPICYRSIAGRVLVVHLTYLHERTDGKPLADRAISAALTPKLLSCPVCGVDVETVTLPTHVFRSHCYFR